MKSEKNPQLDPNRLEKIGGQAAKLLEKTPGCVVRSSLGLTFFGLIFLFKNPSLNNAIMIGGLSTASLLANFPNQIQKLYNYLIASDTPTMPPPKKVSNKDHQPPDKI